MSDRGITKLYYSIGEVSRATGIEPHVLRYWETEFGELSPRKNRGGKRLYRRSDIDLINRIKDLLYNQKYTIEGARRRLREEKGSGRSVRSGVGVGEVLNIIRRGLVELRELLDQK